MEKFFLKKHKKRREEKAHGKKRAQRAKTAKDMAAGGRK